MLSSRQFVDAGSLPMAPRSSFDGSTLKFLLRLSPYHCAEALAVPILGVDQAVLGNLTHAPGV